MFETQWIENYLLKQLPADEALLAEAKILLDAELAEKINWQKTCYTLVNSYGRNNLKKEIEAVHKRLFTETKFKKFRTKITTIFK